MDNMILAFVVMFLPSRMKIFVLNFLGNDVHTSSYIGFSYLCVKSIRLGENSYIGFGNIFTKLTCLKMGAGSRINSWNRFTSDSSEGAVLSLGDNSSISLRHYFDVCDLVKIGNNTIIAGHRSTFFYTF